MHRHLRRILERDEAAVSSRAATGRSPAGARRSPCRVRVPLHGSLRPGPLPVTGRVTDAGRDDDGLEQHDPGPLSGISRSDPVIL